MGNRGKDLANKISSHSVRQTIIATLFILAGCGGGAGTGAGAIFEGNPPCIINCGTPPPPPPAPVVFGPSPDAFPLRVALQQLVSMPHFEVLAASGACSGVAQVQFAAARQTAFAGASAIAVARTLSLPSPSCDAVKVAYDGDIYFDSRYSFAGETAANREHAVPTSALVEVPFSVRVNDNMTLATYAVFADESQRVVTGSRIVSLTAEQNTLNTLILAFTTNDYNTAGALQRSRVVRYRLWGTGSTDLRSLDFREQATGQQLKLLASWASST